MDSDMLKYLQQDAIGKVIAKGLADVYTHKPNAPVKYLAAWLKKYSSNQKEIAHLGSQQTVKAQNLKIFNDKTAVQIHRAEQQRKSQQQHSKHIQDFKKLVSEHEYQQELLHQQLPQFIQQELKLTGTYVGQVNHPPKDITEEDEDENAHLNTSIPKLINYIGSDKSHHALMVGKTLPLDKGVSAAALNLSLDDPQPNEDGVVDVKEKYVYVPNVVKNQNMHYFRLPKLGSYISVPLIYNSYLTEHIFDVALDARLKYLNQLDQWEKAKVEQLKQIEAQRASLQQKLIELTEKNHDESAIETTKADIADNLKRKKESQEEKFEIEKTDLPTQKREFLICGDTIGSDRQIPEKDRNLLVTLVKHFRDSWQQKQRQLLYKDVDYQIRIQKNLQTKGEAVVQRLAKILEISAESKASFDEIEDEHIRQYRKLEWQLSELKKQLRQGASYLATFFKLKNFRVIKYKDVIQTILHFLRYEKKQINIPGKTILNWKRIKATHINANIFFAAIDYSAEGPKKQEFAPYCKISHILHNLQKHNETDIFNYNIGLGAVVHLIKLQLALRQANIELRRQQKQNQRKQRNLLLEQNEKILEEKRQALDKHKQTLVGEDLQAFKQEEWSNKYDEEYPLKEIPEEIVDDIDNDF